MSTALAHLDALPSPAAFYADYWNRRPFLVRGGVAADVIDGLISADELAGLAMEEAARARLLKTAGSTQDWSCAFGPFDEGDFEAAGDRDWSLLVQNVEQFHPDTATLLHAFSFAPRWMLDDIMVGFSAPGGTVGAHIDTYHVFLVQGHGTRRWKISRAPILDEVYIEGLDFRVLVDGFDGDEVEVSCGDVLYIPPKFGHDGVTVESAMTYSVGLLGPKMSELFSGYGQYLGEHEDLDGRYVGDELTAESSGFMFSAQAVDNLRGQLGDQLSVQGFNQWLAEFFTESRHEDFANFNEREGALPLDAFSAALKDGASLIKPHFVKFAITPSASGVFYLGFDRHSFDLDANRFALIQALMREQPVSTADRPDLLDHMEFLHTLYAHEALDLTR